MGCLGALGGIRLHSSGTAAGQDNQEPGLSTHKRNDHQWFTQGDQRFDPQNILLSSRKANLVMVVEKKTGRVVWRLGPDYPARSQQKLPRPVDQIVGPHNPHLIAPGLPGEGNLLLFDTRGEGGYPPAEMQTTGGSRVLEIDPVKKEIVWAYTGLDSDRPAYSFYSSYISNAERLPNGNTFINEGMNGRFFQVTAAGEIVWEYINPHFVPNTVGGRPLSNAVYRAQPVPYGWVPDGTLHSERAVVPPDLENFRIQQAGPVRPNGSIAKIATQTIGMFVVCTEGPIYGGLATSGRAKEGSKMNFAMEPRWAFIAIGKHHARDCRGRTEPVHAAFSLISLKRQGWF
jgi:hypothetical protein